MNWVGRATDVLVGVSAILALLAVAEAGFRSGRARSRRGDRPAHAVVNSVQAAMLGLVGLLLAFSLSMAESRSQLAGE